MTDSVTGPVLDPVIPTQLAFPARALLRTIVQWFVGAAIAWLLRVLGLDLTGFSSQIIDLLTALIAVLGTILVTWVMTRPAVAKVLAGTILAPAPARV